MKVNVNTTPNQTSNSKTNPNPQTPQQNLNVNNPQNPQINQLLQIFQQLMQNNVNQTPQNNLSNLSNNTNTGEFIVKANMKSSYVALKVEQLLMAKRKVTLAAVGYAIPILVDSVMLVRKDLKRETNMSMELFEKEVVSGSRKKIVSGVRVTLQI